MKRDRIKNKIALGFMPKRALADSYGVTVKTLSSWLKEWRLWHKLRYFGYKASSHYFSLRQVLIIFETLDYAEGYDYIPEGKIRYLPLTTYSKGEIARL